MKELIASGNLINEADSIQDLERATDIFGPSAAAMKKKRPRRNIPLLCHFKVDIISCPLLLHWICCNVMTEVLSPKSTPVATEDMAKFARKSHAMKRSQYKMFNSNRAHNYSIEKLLIDNEIGVVSLTTEIERLGCVVNPAGPGQHVPLVEHKPKLVKERRRCHIHHVPFAIPFVMELYLIYHCVYTLNLMPTKTL